LSEAAGWAELMSIISADILFFLDRLARGFRRAWRYKNLAGEGSGEWSGCNPLSARAKARPALRGD
jgi:hypothetical protein